MFKGWSSNDFRVQSIMGKPMLTVVNYHEGAAYVLDDTYKIYAKIPMRNDDTGIINMHEFLTVDHGTRALYLTHDPAMASRAESRAVGYNDGRCSINQDGFKELDVATWESTHSWTSARRIALTESYEDELPLTDRCDISTGDPWDYL